MNQCLSMPRQGGRQPIDMDIQNTMLKQINRITEEKLGFSSYITIFIKLTAP
ncbi:MAG: ISH3 family transposase partial [Methanobrevibacter sp. CfCl-M3]